MSRDVIKAECLAHILRLATQGRFSGCAEASASSCVSHYPTLLTIAIVGKSRHVVFNIPDLHWLRIDQRIMMRILIRLLFEIVFGVTAMSSRSFPLS